MDTMKNKGYNGYAVVAEINGVRMEFATEKEMEEYLQGDE